VVILETIEQLFSKSITGLEGFEIGRIKDFDVEHNTWRLTSLVIALSDKAIKQVKLKKTILRPRACFPISAFTISEGKILLNKPLKELLKDNHGLIECPREAIL
jgi:hypothetical protein